VIASYAAAALLGGIALLLTRISTAAVLATLVMTLLACLSLAFALKKVDMTL
jgi:hypothetical protein